MKTEFLQKALEHVPIPEILINLVSRRVKQLGQGFRPLVPVDPRWSFMDVALKEIGDEKLTCEMVDRGPAKAKGPRSRRRRL